MSEASNVSRDPVEPRPATAPRRLTEIVTDRLNTNHNRALECLRALDELSADDLARDDFRAAAQTFATLALADVMTSPGTGRNLAETIAQAGGIQP